MRVTDTPTNYNTIYRRPSYIQLYKLVSSRVENTQTLYTWDFTSIPITDDTKIVDEVDPIVNDFDTFFQRGLDKELNDEKALATANLKRWRDAELLRTYEFELTDSTINYTTEQLTEVQTYRGLVRTIVEDTIDVLNPVYPYKPQWLIDHCMNDENIFIQMVLKAGGV